jgi:uncharacterized protein YjaZ
MKIQKHPVSSFDSNLETEFTIHGEDHGTYYSETKRAVIYLSSHESLDDVLKTITHEVLHHCIEHCDAIIDEEQEHKLIYCVQWADEYT